MSAGVFARVAGRELSELSGNHVLLLGKVVSTSDSEAQVTSADGTTITVKLQGGEEIPQTGSWYQFKGKAETPSKIQEYSRTNAGDGSVEIDLPSYIKLCEMWNGKHSGIFKPLI